MKKISLLKLPLRHRGSKTFPASKKFAPVNLSVSATTYTGVDALFENESYAYYNLSETPAYYITAWYNLFHTQIGVGNRLNGGRRRVKKYLWSFFKNRPGGAGQAVTCSTSGMGLRLK